MIHHGDVASGLNCDLVSGFDNDGQKRVRFGADLVGCDGPEGVDEPYIVTQAVNLLPGAVNLEFAVVLDEG